MKKPVYAHRLDFHDRVEGEILRPMMAWLCEGRALDILDAGCGEGGPTLMLAETGARVWGIDEDVASVEKARALANETEFAAQITLAQGDATALKFADATFDLVWCSYVAHHIADKVALARELKRVLKRGGRLALREDGLPLQMLPLHFGLGEAGFQDRLRVAQNVWFERMTRATLPDEKFYPFGWTRVLADAGFTNITAKTFVTDFSAPFDDAQREFVLHQLQRVWERDHGEYGPLLSEADRAVLKRLIDPEDDFFILKRDDLHVRYGLSVYVGENAGPRR